MNTPIPFSRGRVLLAIVLAGCCLAQRPPTPASPGDDLAHYIREEQRRHVRLSTGIYAHECFTDENYRAFRAAHTADRVAEAAKRSPRFLAIAASIGQLAPERREVLLAEAARIAHPTWAALGRITPDGSGQTSAGAAAERGISAALVAAVREILKDRPGAKI